MNTKFDELTKGMAQSVTRRAALKKFGVGLVAAVAASLGITSAAAAPKTQGYCAAAVSWEGYTGYCYDPSTCKYATNSNCIGGRRGKNAVFIDNPCLGIGALLDINRKCSF